MADLWLPGFAVHKLKAGGPYDDTSNPKLGWHTWEGLSWSAAETAFRNYPPHIGCKPPHPGVPADEVGKHQYVPLNRHAYAFAGSESDDEYIIQVEVAGRAAESSGWTDEVCEWLAVEIVDPIAETVGVPPVVVPGGFFDSTNYRPSVSGAYLGSPKSEIRLTAAELRRFSGHLGHQHMPPPDSHWDPGRLPIDRILAHRTTGDDMALTEADAPIIKAAVESALNSQARKVRGITSWSTYLGNVLGAARKAATADGDDPAEIARLVLEGLDGESMTDAQVRTIIDAIPEQVKVALRGGTG